MWPVLLDMTKEECIQNLRHLGNIKNVAVCIIIYKASQLFQN